MASHTRSDTSSERTGRGASGIYVLTLLLVAQKADEFESATDRCVTGPCERERVANNPDSVGEREGRVGRGSLLPKFGEPVRRVSDGVWRTCQYRGGVV